MNEFFKKNSVKDAIAPQSHKGYWVAVALCLICLMSFNYAVLTDDIQSYYNFDESSGNLLDQVTTNDGTNSGVTQGSGGIIDNAYTYGAADYTSIANGTLDLQGVKSVNVWVYPTSFAASEGMILSKASGGAVIPFRIADQAFGAGDGKPVLYIGSNTGDISITSTIAMTLNQWNMVTTTWTGDTTVNGMKIYVNGSLGAEGTFSGTQETSTNPSYFGKNNSTGNGGFAGRLDETGIWNKVLTQTEITELYNSGAGFPYPFITESVTADFDYVIDKTNLKIDFNDTSISTNTTIDSWTWSINGSDVNTDQNFSFTTTQLTDINACLTIDNNDDTLTDSNCQQFNTGDWEAPTTTFTSTDTNITLTCTDNNIGCEYINFRINNGDWNYYLIGDNPLTIDFTTTDNNIYYYSSDFNDNNEATKFSYFPLFTNTVNQSGSYITLNGASIYANDTITNWQWLVNGSALTGTTQDKNYFTSANLDLNVCLITTPLHSYCQSVETWDTITPTIDVNISNDAFGFVSDFNINWDMACYDNFTPINYTVTWVNDGNTTYLYSSDDANASVYSSWLDLNQGQSAALTFTCTDDYNNFASYTSETLYAILFRLVNEDTGVDLSFQDINQNFAAARVYTLDGNYSYDFNAEETSTATFFSPSEALWFEFGYDDGTKINRQIDFGVIEDQNIGICVPYYQTFYQQRFVANTAKTIILKNNVSDCYTVAGTLNYVYDTGYSLTTYTIPKPYYLYTYSNGVKSYLALIDGGVPTAYNIDAIEFSRSSFELAVGQDTVAFQPLKNSSGVYDTNTVQIYYSAYPQSNDSTKFDIYNGTTLLWTYTETETPNELFVSFYWGDEDLNADTVLELRVTKTVGEDSSSQSFYFNTMGNAYQNTVANEWAAIIAVIFFLFGITLVSVNRALGIFGIIVGVISLFFVNLASGAWWINLLAGAFIILIMYIILLTKQTGGQLT